MAQTARHQDIDPFAFHSPPATHDSDSDSETDTETGTEAERQSRTTEGTKKIDSTPSQDVKSTMFLPCVTVLCPLLFVCRGQEQRPVYRAQSIECISPGKHQAPTAVVGQGEVTQVQTPPSPAHHPEEAQAKRQSSFTKGTEKRNSTPSKDVKRRMFLPCVAVLCPLLFVCRGQEQRPVYRAQSIEGISPRKAQALPAVVGQVEVAQVQAPPAPVHLDAVPEAQVHPAVVGQVEVAQVQAPPAPVHLPEAQALPAVVGQGEVAQV